MQLLNKTVGSFESANYVIAQLNRGINTSYIPSGDNINEVISNFTKIQLGRSFNPNGCYSSADLFMEFTENHLLISYSSTSLTSVNIWYKFDNNMELTDIEFSVWIPDDRAMSGRTHYECLTREFYEYQFIKVDWTAKSAEVVVPWDMVKLNNDWLVSDNIPHWVDEKISNYNAVWNSDNTAAELLELGYVPVNNPIGFKSAFYNPNHYYQYVVVNVKLNEVDNNYYLLNDAGSKLWNDGGVSYLRLIEMIKSAVNNEPRKSKVEVIEDYEYDENEQVYDEYDYANDED